MPDCHAILCDLQAPYHSRTAVDVACQILEDAKPLTLTLNGDMVDCRKLAGRYPSDDGAREMLISQLKEEFERSGTVIRHIIKRAKAKKNYWVDGNHEWRVWRAMMQTPQTIQLMGIDLVREALSPISLLKLSDLKLKYIGEYPKGFWLKGEAVPPEKNVWIEHGYLIRSKSGYTASALMDKRMTNVVCGHVERQGIIWKSAVGKRSFFGIEGGNLSMIGEPGKGDSIYTGVPHSVPDYMDHQSGITLIYEADGVFYPELVRIRDGKAVWRGKLYTAKPDPTI